MENNTLILEYNTTGSRRGKMILDIERAFKAYNQADFRLLLDTVDKCDNAGVIVEDVNAYLLDMIEKLTAARDKTDDFDEYGKKERARLNKDIKHYAGLQNILVKRYGVDSIEKDQEATAKATPCDVYIFEHNICIDKNKGWKITRGGFDFIVYIYKDRYYVRLDGVIPCVIQNKRSKAEAIKCIETRLIDTLKTFEGSEKMDFLRKEYIRIVEVFEHPEETEAEAVTEVITEDRREEIEQAEAVTDQSEETEAPPEVVTNDIITEVPTDNTPPENITRIDKHRQHAQFNKVFLHKVIRRAKYDLKKFIRAA